MKELVEYLAKSLVDAPDVVEVAESNESDVVRLKLKVGKDDLGKVIGKKGRTAKAMRTVLSAAATKLDKRVYLEIVE